MALSQELDINQTEILTSIWSSLPPEVFNRIILLLDITKWLLIAWIVYLLISLIVKILSLRNTKLLSSIEHAVTDINIKLSKSRKK
ncbi:MAG TPA: hypothetical protein VJK51_00230 [Candidatus Nanoarchaeia archaeon]|nr:hypothetical protein [Candidatus Nanoarchaeia archaeon]